MLGAALTPLLWWIVITATFMFESASTRPVAESQLWGYALYTFGLALYLVIKRIKK